MRLDENIAAIVSGGASGLGAAVVRHLRDREVKTALFDKDEDAGHQICLLYTSPSPRDQRGYRMPSSA